MTGDELLEQVYACRAECTAMAAGQPKRVQQQLLEFRDTFANCAEQLQAQQVSIENLKALVHRQGRELAERARFDTEVKT